MSRDSRVYTKTQVLRSTVDKDLSTFQGIIERIYASSNRLIFSKSSTTADITDVLSSAQNHETFVEIILESVSRQVASFGCGGRTVSLWICLFFRLLQNLKEVDSAVCVNSVVELALEHCIEKLSDISLNTSDFPVGRLAKMLSHGVKDHELANELFSSGPPNIPENISVVFEKSSEPSCVTTGHVIKARAVRVSRGVKRVLVVAGDIAPDSGHVGYRGLVKEQTVTTVDSKVTVDWNTKLKSFLGSMNVEVVLCPGICKVDFMNTGVVIVQECSYDVLDQITGDNDVIPSIEFATHDDVINLEFEILSDSLTIVKSSSQSCYTILLRGLVESGIEKRYQTFLGRMKNAVRLGKVLPGRGGTEKHCSKILSTFRISEEDSSRYNLDNEEDVFLMTNIVSTQLSDVFLKVANLTATNTQFDCLNSDFPDLSFDDNDFYSELDKCNEDEGSCDVLDDLSSKVGAWRLALETARVLDSVKLCLKPFTIDNNS